MITAVSAVAFDPPRDCNSDRAHDDTQRLAAYAVPGALHSIGDFAFIDVETTGAKPLEDRVTEVAILRIHADGSLSR